MSQRLKIIFAGTPDFAARHLQCLLDSHHQVVAVYSQPDRPAGRGKKLQASPVKQLATTAQIPVYQPKSLRNLAAQQELAALDADLMVVVAYGLLLPQEVLDTPRLGCINVHGSLLPKWRGAAPIQRAIWAGDQNTGVTIMQMDAGLDTGAMLLKKNCPILPEDTSASLYETLAQIGPSALLETLDEITNDTLTPQSQQNADATYAHKLSKEEGRLDWTQSAIDLERQIRAFNPWPMSYFERDGQMVRVWQAQTEPLEPPQAPGTIVSAQADGIVIATGDGALRIITLQPAGKKTMSARDLLNSKRDWFPIGQLLGGKL